ncbi:hypothetical protein C2U70_07315 [Bradyrhizobium guangdongense]|uniref:hypothetical protein n=1 Tax=Bradyrhizobium guangdongense TaxID=1325090 RepID=UPI001128751D|nr:hypothetical protein [Bradyrhizobium guangdongense]TPQ39315.1 hypothetical protein C2U70_07315 [Bradyrhizobium guangdongense]
MQRAATILVAVIALSALSGVGAYQMTSSRQGPHWQEIAWPFPRDGWPAGRAFRCDGRSCDGVELYVRAKRGFCNCDRGVADDEEVDRVADIDLITPRFTPMAHGDGVKLGDMQGRVRHYALTLPDGTPRTVAAIAVSRRCDLLVAVAQGRAEARTAQHMALAFLETEPLAAWTIAALEGR